MNYNKKSIADIDVLGKKVLVRCDLNTPQNEDLTVSDATRIILSIPTIKYLAEKGAKVILCSHLGRPKGKWDDKLSLAPIALETQKQLGLPVLMAPDVVGEGAFNMASNLKNGQVMLLENVRFEPQEEKNDREFSKKLGSIADIYVNDAFGTSHRAHSSTAGVAEFLPAVAGFLMERELSFLGGALTSPKRPFIGILGGSKVSDKIMVIENLLNVCDDIIIGGAMAYTFAEARGGKIGKSMCEPDKIDVAKYILKLAKEKNVNFYTPVDHIAADSFSPDAKHTVIQGDNIPDGLMALDIGPETLKQYVEVINKAKTIVWNGPMGVFEFDAFSKGTFGVARAVAENVGAISIIGGGDSVSAAAKCGVTAKITHISTGGGASLKLLEGAVLPSVAALLDK